MTNQQYDEKNLEQKFPIKWEDNILGDHILKI